MNNSSTDEEKELFDYWLKMPTWTTEAAVALLVARTTPGGLLELQARCDENCSRIELEISELLNHFDLFGLLGDFRPTLDIDEFSKAVITTLDHQEGPSHPPKIWTDCYQLLPNAKPLPLTQSTTVSVQLAGRWPWGNHETNLLNKLAAAAQNFWDRYDPSDASTAPTNKQVIDWLTKNDVSKRTAEVMASILRADGLPSGPRK